MMTILSASFSFASLLQLSTAAVFIAFCAGLLGILFSRDDPLDDSVILIKKEASDAA